MGEHWERLVAVAMLGTDRRNPPEAPHAIAALVDDTLRSTPAERMLAQVAATVAVRRAAVLPGPVVAALAGPPPDERPVVPATAASRWYELTTRWPVLEDEWMVTLIERGWRVRPELVPDLLVRHRGDRVRRLRVHVACGPLAAWLVAQLPEVGDASDRGGALAAAGAADVDALLALPDIPVPPDLVDLLDASGPRPGAAVAAAIAAGRLGHAHRAVLVNLLARTATGPLDDIRRTLTQVDPLAPGGALAASLVDLVATRQAMLAELAGPVS